MNAIEQLLDYPRRGVRAVMHHLAIGLDTVTFGKITPNFVTVVGLLGHVWVAYLIAARHPIWAAGFLIIFGLMDSLDGELARIQKKASNAGMLLDATADRLKEVLLFTAIAYFFVEIGRPYDAVWAVAALGTSQLVSYIKAKGETALSGSGLSANEINRVFSDGLARFEVRMALVVIGLFTALLPEMLVLITILSIVTAIYRFMKIAGKIDVQS